jgi:hypothetical protein
MIAMPFALVSISAVAQPAAGTQPGAPTEQAQPQAAPTNQIEQPTTGLDEQVPPDLKSAPEYPLSIVPHAVNSWSARTSEEYPPLTASNGRLISAMRCTGSYCDNVYLGYENVSGASYGANYWTGYFSEEGANNRTCAGNYFMTGISCKGSYCDDVALQCTDTRKTKVGCQWQPYFSEEAAYSYLPQGYYAAGLGCRGSYCDDKTIYACRAQ